METNDNVKALAKLGVDSKDIANVYLEITEEGKDIPKDVYINNLTKTLKFFQSRNSGIENNTDEAIYKENVLDMIKNNPKLVGSDLNKNIKTLCSKLDTYYFMKPGYTNKVIKQNPKIFNINSTDLEKYSTIFSNFAIKVDGQIVNLFEYIIKKDSDILTNDVQKFYEKIIDLETIKKSKLITEQELNKIRGEILL